MKGRARFGETLDVLQRLSASYRRCCTILIEKGVFLAAESWRQEYGGAARQAAIKEGGGEVPQYVRAGMDPYPMMGWRIREVEGGGACVYEGPNGEVYEDLREAYEQEVAARSAQTNLD